MSGVVLSGFDEALDAVEEMATEIHQKAHLQVSNGVTEKMPVDTGRARGGTLNTLGSPGGGDPGREDKSGSSVRSEAESTSRKIKLGDDSFVSNAVEYVSFLEDGSSQQAPRGMFQITVEEVVGQFS